LKDALVLTQKKPFSIWIAITLSTVICSITVLSLGFVKLLKDRQSVFVAPAQFRGSSAPDFNLPSLSGENLNLSDFRGQAVVINFWTIWCDPCKEEMPLLASLPEKYGADLSVIAINEGDSAADAKNFLEEENIEITILLDEDRKVGEDYKIGGYPTSIFIDKEGIIQAIYLGELSEEQLKSNLKLIGIE